MLLILLMQLLNKMLIYTKDWMAPNNTNNMIGYQDSTLKDLINIYINKKNKFINLIKK